MSLHCVIDYKSPPVVFRCQHCGGTSPFPLPLKLSQMKALTDQFMAEHRNCSLKKDGKG